MRAGWGVAAFGALVALAPSFASAVYLDDADTLQLLGRVYSQTAFRTEDSSGFTFPKTASGHMVQNRNLVEIELAHALDSVLVSRPSWVGDLGYRLRFKGVYE